VKKWYIVVEGRHTERHLYRSWLGHLFPEFRRAERIEDMTAWRYHMIVGHGYPSYLNRIKAAVADIRGNDSAFDHLMVCIDAEDRTIDERRAEIKEIITEAGCPVSHSVVVHDCCIETWLLGNATMAKRDPQSQALREYQTFYDVRISDPEHMQSIDTGRTRAQFHCDYLQEMFNERGQSYSKRHPGHAREPTYLQALADRVASSGHLRSLDYLLTVWRGFGADI
jgi:hypothetical protein